MLVIVDYGLGNLRSVANALAALGAEATVSSDPDVVATCDRLILPGVGSFGRAVENIRGRGLWQPLEEAGLRRKVPVLGICLGMQLLAGMGEENGPAEGLGWIPGTVKRFSFDDPSIRIPHVGFNAVMSSTGSERLLGYLRPAQDFYFVHSYRMICENTAHVAAWCDYHGRFVAAVERDNIFGTQFHPEKSQANGLALLARFLKL